MERKVKLFCIPGGGASAVMYLRWSKVLSRNIKLCLLELPGRGLRKNEPTISDIDILTEDLFENWKKEMSSNMEADYMIIGYCFGAIAAYELYKKISNSGLKKPVHMFFGAGDSADGKVYSKSFFSDESTKPEVYDLLSRYFPEHIFKDKNVVSQFCVNYTDTMYSHYSEYGKVVPIRYDEICIEQKDKETEFQIKKCLEFANETLQVLGNDIEIARVYQTTEHEFISIQCDVTVLAGEDDTMTPIAEVENWKNLCDGTFNLRRFPGGHQLLIDSYEVCMPFINSAAERRTQ